MLNRSKCRVQKALLSGVFSCPSFSLPTHLFASDDTHSCLQSLPFKKHPNYLGIAGVFPQEGGADTHLWLREAHCYRLLGLKQLLSLRGINLPLLHKARRTRSLPNCTAPVDPVRVTGPAPRKVALEEVPRAPVRY